MADELVRLQEECGCGAKLAAQGPASTLADVYKALSLWRQEHACKFRANHTVPKALGDWRDAYIGLDCTVCTGSLTSVSTLTTVSGRQIHTACRRCKLCRRTKPTMLRWATDFKLEVPENVNYLVHPKCGKEQEVREIEQAQFHAVQLRESGTAPKAEEIPGRELSLHPERWQPTEPVHGTPGRYCPSTSAVTGEHSGTASA